MRNDKQRKITWGGVIVSIQPRTTVWRYRLDNRTHSEIGYTLFLDGVADGEQKRFSVGISELQLNKSGFRIGDEATGTAWTKLYAETEYADYYRAGALKRVAAGVQTGEPAPPPYLIAPPDLQTYSRRGARQLSRARWRGKCFQCAWATMSAVAIEYDWGVSQKFRFESFCYGPKSCKFYDMGKPRPVPYKGDTPSYDDGGLDDICAEGRGYDE